jgi:2-oxoglutarate dehydrogenase E1 component
MGKPYRAIFHEFKGGSSARRRGGSGDVKYHLGASPTAVRRQQRPPVADRQPSHLEIVNPVVRAGARQAGQLADAGAAPGHAAPAARRRGLRGQGVVAECSALSGLKGYRTGRHGSTSSSTTRSASPRPALLALVALSVDVAKMVEAPIFHVQRRRSRGGRLRRQGGATEYRRIPEAVVIDIFCYRRFGHNEGDEPSFSPAEDVKIIRQHPSTLVALLHEVSSPTAR